jgi:general secretion pathway protein D
VQVPSAQTPPAAPGEAAPPPSPENIAAAQAAAADLAKRMTAQGGAMAGKTAPAVGAPKLAFQASATEVDLNQSVTVNLVIENIQDLFAAPMRIVFDSKVLRLTEVSRGPFLSSDGAQVTFSETKIADPGGVIVSMNRLPGSGGISGQGTLLTLKFQAAGRGVAMLSFEELVLRDGKLNTLSVQPPSMAIRVK